METIENDKFTAALAKFNIEANLDPWLFEGKCFSDMENEILSYGADKFDGKTTTKHSYS